MRYHETSLFPVAVSTIGLGCNNFGGRLDSIESVNVIRAAIDVGITLFDTADTYGGQGASEIALGQALRNDRTKVVVATKFGFGAADMGYGPMPRGSEAYIRVALGHSLRRLQTDYIDLYYLHSPDPKTPVSETVGALADLANEGLILAYGISNHSAAQVAAWCEVCTQQGLPLPAAVQERYSILSRGIEDELMPLCSSLGLGVVPYWPLENGMLTGKLGPTYEPCEGTRLYSRKMEITEARTRALSEIARWARDRRMSMLAVALAYLMSEPSVLSVIPGAMSADQIRMNASCGDATLSSNEREGLRALIDSVAQ